VDQQCTAQGVSFSHTLAMPRACCLLRPCKASDQRSHCTVSKALPPQVGGYQHIKCDAEPSLSALRPALV
jgi:hypothetical protein